MVLGSLLILGASLAPPLLAPIALTSVVSKKK